ncbi:YeeE/YedE thiosulfate transporter family protein, partial [Salmonella enterica]
MNRLENETTGVFNKKQIIIAVTLVILLTIFGSYLGYQKEMLSIQLFSGILLGGALTRTRFGYAGGIKRIYVRGEGSLSKALLIMLLATMLIFMGVQWYAAQNGAVPAFSAVEGDAIIPGTQNVQFANLATVIGGVLFGMGMIFS